MWIGVLGLLEIGLGGENASTLGSLVGGLSGLLLLSPHWSGSVDPKGIKPLVNPQCWHLGSVLGP